MVNIKSVLLWAGTCSINLVAIVEAKVVLTWLGGVNTLLVIVYHAVKIRNEIKSKK